MLSYYLGHIIDIYQKEGFIGLVESVESNLRVKYLELKMFLNHYIVYVNYKKVWGKSYPKFTNLIYVDPGDIKYRLDPGLEVTHNIQRGTYLLSGDWDKSPISDEIWYSRSQERSRIQKKLKLENYLLYISMRQRYEQNYAWEETKIYSYIDEENFYENNVKSYDHPKSIKKRATRYDQLYHNISNNGYLTQKKLQTVPIYPEYSEILVHIGRNGELYLGQGGRHRLGLAKVLNLKTIPVRVSVRHRQWQELRGKVYFNNIFDLHEDLKNHPDLQDIRS